MKKLQIAAMAAGVLLLTGCGNKVVQNTAEQNSADNVSAPKTEEKSVASDMVTSMKDAMASGKMMKCDYAIKGADGQELTTTSYVNGKKYMTTMAVAGNIQHMIFDETAMYSWTEGQKQGTKMTMACTQELAKNLPKNTDATAPDPTGEKTFNSATNVSCSPANNVDFSLPTDVSFSDQCEMMKNLQKNLSNVTAIPNMPKGVPTNLPTGVPQP